ncbi:MAG: hypothetical protein AAF787_16530 [Chloroflexota bacterium]
MNIDVAGYAVIYTVLIACGALALRQQLYRWCLIAALVMTAGFAGSLLFVLYHLFLFGFVLVICGIPAALFGDQTDVEGAAGFAGRALGEPIFLVNAVAAAVLLALMLAHYRAWRRLRDRAQRNN